MEERSEGSAGGQERRGKEVVHSSIVRGVFVVFPFRQRFTRPALVSGERMRTSVSGRDWQMAFGGRGCTQGVGMRRFPRERGS